MWFVKRIDMQLHWVDPCVVCEKNRHAMTLTMVNEKSRHAITQVDPCVVYEKNTHPMNSSGSILA